MGPWDGGRWLVSFGRGAMQSYCPVERWLTFNVVLISLLLHTLLRNSIVWCTLALELTFEYLIRPPDYPDLIESDQAYAPSTARNINAFHLVFESVALILFIPELRCLFDANSCGQSVPWSGLWASVHAVDGSDSSMAAAGRLCLGLTSLRLFGLVRHWKQMWINNTFAEDRQSHNLVRRFLLLEYDGKGKDPSKVRTVLGFIPI
jgi:hypothetical protein